MPRYCDRFSIPFILQKLLHDHRMDSIVHCSSSKRDSRALFYFVSLANEDKVVCFHVRSLKNSRDVTVSLVCINLCSEHVPWRRCTIFTNVRIIIYSLLCSFMHAVHN